MLIDDFIDNYGNEEAYARWVFNHFRLPASLKFTFDQFMKDHHLYCTYLGQRYRVTGASRLGDVWLHSDFSQSVGYELRVDVEKLSDFSPHSGVHRYKCNMCGKTTESTQDCTGDICTFTPSLNVACNGTLEEV